MSFPPEARRDTPAGFGSASTSRPSHTRKSPIPGPPPNSADCAAARPASNSSKGTHGPATSAQPNTPATHCPGGHNNPAAAGRQAGADHDLRPLDQNSYDAGVRDATRRDYRIDAPP